MNVAYLGWCPMQTAYTAYSIVHVAQTGPQGHFSVRPQRSSGSSPPDGLTWSGPTGLLLRLLRVVPDLRVGMRRAASPPRGEARPQKHICPPQMRSPLSDLSQPPPEAWCAERVHPHFSSAWQLGYVFVFPPLQSVLLPRVRGHSRVLSCSLPGMVRTPCRPPVSPALHSPSTQTRTPGAFLRGGGRLCFQAFSTPHLRYVFPCTTLCFLYRISFTNGNVYRGYHCGFSAQFGPATHFSLGKIPPASTGFNWQ